MGQFDSGEKQKHLLLFVPIVPLVPFVPDLKPFSKNLIFSIFWKCGQTREIGQFVNSGQLNSQEKIFIYTIIVRLFTDLP